MKPSIALERHRDAIRKIVESHRSGNVRVFGSVARGEDTESSDLDLLVDPHADATMLDVAAIQVKLEKLLGVRVDVLTPRALPDVFVQQVIAEAVTI